MTLIAVVRLRGTSKKSKRINYALKLMGLTRVNHCVLLKEDDCVKGQLKRVKDFVTYGEINDDILKLLIEKRARKAGNKKLDALFYKDSKLDLSKVLALYKNNPKDAYEKGIKKVFRLSPPSKGLNSIKKGFNQKGDLGNRGKAINDLLKKMI